MKSTSRLPKPSVFSAYGLLCLGLTALVSAAVPGESLFREMTPLALLAGDGFVHLPSLVIGGSLVIVGLTAVTLGTALLLARVTLATIRHR